VKGETIEGALRTAAFAALEWIDAIDPPDIFIGKSEDADEGVKMIVKIREDLRVALSATEEEPGDDYDPGDDDRYLLGVKE